jgi:penicillin-binding protein 1A
LDNLVDAGFMTEGQVFGARRNPATAVDRRDENSPNYYLDWAFDEMRRLVDTFPKSYSERVFVVRTAIDMNVQHAAENAIENQLRQFGRDYHATQAATVVADLDGGVRAIVGGRDYGASQFNRATDAMRQPGSSFKPYVYSTALMTGMTPNTTVVDAPICVGNWCPHNYGGGFSGAQPMWNALKNSINTVAVYLTRRIGNGNDKLGRQKVIETARRMGIVTPLPDTPSLPIGADEVNVLEHTVAYATFPNLGMAVTPHAILEVRTGAGETIWRFDRDGPKPRRAIPPKVATDMIFMMNKVVEEGTARRAMLNGVKAAGKTGTTNSYRDAWFVGYTGNFVAGVWFGNDDYSPTNRMTGGALPAMTWHEIMEYAHQGIELKNLPGLPPNPSPTAPVAQNSNKDDTPRPAMLTFRGAQVLVQVEHMMEDAKNALPAAAHPANARAATDQRAAERDTGPFAAADERTRTTSGD